MASSLKSSLFSGTGGSSGGLFKLFKLLPMLTSGCKMAALLSRHPNNLLSSSAATATVTLFGHRKGRITLAIHDDTRASPAFLIELPVLAALLHKEMASGVVRIALESGAKTPRRRLVEEHVWTVYCNGRRSGFSVRRRHLSEEERYVMGMLRGVSVGAGVLPCLTEKEAVLEGELTYMRARFERVIGSKDSESFYMINPDGAGEPELSVFLVRVK